jgi:hypothetical protein
MPRTLRLRVVHVQHCQHNRVLYCDAQRSGSHLGWLIYAPAGWMSKRLCCARRLLAKVSAFSVRASLTPSGTFVPIRQVQIYFHSRCTLDRSPGEVKCPGVIYAGSTSTVVLQLYVSRLSLIMIDSPQIPLE